jgi:hypothetical protein
MKRITTILLLAILQKLCVLGQVSHTGNAPIGGNEFVGWNGTATKPMDIRNNATYAIDFYTDSLFRVTIDSLNGFIGAGLRLPQNQIHQHNSDATGNTYHQFTTGNTNSNANNGLRIGLTYDVTSGLCVAEFLQFQNSPIDGGGVEACSIDDNFPDA